MVPSDEYHLAQLNIGRLKVPLESPPISDFVAALEPINALADASPGFIWRLQTEDGDATAVRVFDDDLIIVNMSLWRSIDDLREFVYRSGHADVLRRRREWFDRMVQASVVLWWVPSGTTPTVHDAISRLAHLDAHGPTPLAFTFRVSFPGPGTPDASVGQVDDRWECPIG